jgi:hypothetical protein
MCKYTLFYVSLAYRSFFIGRTTLKGAKEVWRAAVPPKVKFFFWLALHGRLWTAERRRRHGLQNESPYTLCDQEDETSDHLLAACVYSHDVWLHILSLAGLAHLAPPDDAASVDWWP